MTIDTTFDTLWLAAGKSYTNHSNMTKGSLPESWSAKKARTYLIGSNLLDRPRYSHSLGGKISFSC